MEHVRCGEQEEQHHDSKGVVWAETVHCLVCIVHKDMS